jgi:PadR family transcriptional regulator, regulatory protein AphA
VPNRLTATSQAILGLLSMAPMSGYDLAQAAEHSVRPFWPISKSQVYAELARLEPMGLVRGTEIAQEGRPDKRVFRLTEPGEAVLDSWLESADLGAPRFRLPFLLKVFFGHRTAPERTAELLRQVRDEARAEAAELGSLLGVMNHPDAAYARLTVSFGVRMAEAIAAWAEEAGACLPPGRIEIDPRRAGSTTAAGLFRAAARQNPGDDGGLA